MINLTKKYAFILGLASVFILGLSSCSKKVVYNAPTAITEEITVVSSLEKQIAYQFVTVAKNDNSFFETSLGDSFVSRDQNWKGEKQSFINNRNQDSSYSRMEPIRILHDGSFVALHSRMLGDTLRFRWDILRIENEKILEHWSNVNDSIGLNPDKHTEIDGPTLPTQLEKTDTNRALISRFINQCMIREDGGASKFFNFGLYIQHNRDVGDGVNGLLWGMYKMKRKGHVIKFKHNYNIIAEGNFVLSSTEGFVGEEKYVFYDLFRIEKSKIIEHWDIIAPVDDFIYYHKD